MENIIPKLKLRSLELMHQAEVRVRYAPSPTGALHIGGARTALFNYLFAKKNNGVFILRIEDTDLERSKKVFEKDIFDALKWLDVKWDEGPIPESDQYLGSFGPYRQSERGEIYEKYIKKILDNDKAYHCFCSSEDLEAQKQYQMGRGESPKYAKTCAEISKKEVERMKAEGKRSVIRLRAPLGKIKFDDLIRGDIEIDSETIGDIVIAKDLKTPLYNMAVVIDDFEMKITHVIRGEDHIPNTPKQMIIASALDIPHPIYTHLPLVLGPDKSKMSKRHGAVSVTEYKKQGYLPEAIINFMAFLGWSPGTNMETYSMDELIKDFTLEKIQKSGAVFNIKKLDHINSSYIRGKDINELVDLSIPFLLDSGLMKEESGKYFSAENGKEISILSIRKAVSLHRERMKILSEISEFADFLFKDEIVYDKELLKWKDMTEDDLREALDIIENILSGIKDSDWNEKGLEDVLMPVAEKMQNRGVLLWPLRAALTGKKASAGPFEVAEALGKERTLLRIKKAKEKI